MNCEHYLELMSAALDGECTAEERRALDSHLAVCPECADLFRILSANANAARELDCEMPADLKSRIMNNLPQQEKAAKQGKVISLKRWIPVAAAACLVLVISLVPGALGGGKNSAPEAAMDQIAVRDSDAYSYGVSDAAEEPMADADGHAGSTPAEYYEVESTEYSLSNQQFIHIGINCTPGAQIIGSVESLEKFLSDLRINLVRHMTVDESNALVLGNMTADEFEALYEAYQEEFFGNYTKRFFRKHHLLCVIVKTPTCCNRYELDSLTRDTVTVLQTAYGFGDAVDAYLLIAEVDTVFNDGDTLEVNIIRK